jgi:valyl-tRNA synthetase
MSKSYGNVIDPLGVMEELGTDALRFTLLVGSTPGNDMNLSIKKVEANRNFANKIWNAGRYVLSVISEEAVSDQRSAIRNQQSPVNFTAAIENQKSTLADRWIWARGWVLARDVERLFQNYQYGEAGRQIYDFFWGDFADWYVEISKLQMEAGGEQAQATAQNLVRLLDLSLRLLHPFTPFITEEVWGHLKTASQGKLASLAGDWEEALIVAAWPDAPGEEDWERSAVEDFGLVQEVVRAIRNLRSEKNVKAGRRIPATLVSEGAAGVMRDQAAAIAALAQLDPQALNILESLPERPEGHIALVVGPVEVYLPLAGLVDTKEERQRLEKDLADLQSQIERLEALLASPFAQKAPPPVVQKERDKLAGFQETAEKVRAQLDMLE